MRHSILMILLACSSGIHARCLSQFPNGEYFKVEVQQCESYQNQLKLDLQRAKENYGRVTKISKRDEAGLAKTKLIKARILEKVEFISWHDGKNIINMEGATISTLDSAAETFLVSNFPCPESSPKTVLLKKPEICCDTVPPKTLACISPFTKLTGVEIKTGIKINKSLLEIDTSPKGLLTP